MNRRTSGRSATWLLIPAALAIGIVLLWEGSLTDQDPPADAVKPLKADPEPEPKKFALVQGEDTEFERVPSAPASQASLALSPPTAADRDVGTLLVTLSVGSDHLGQGWIEIGRQEVEDDLFAEVRHATVDPDSREAKFGNLPFGRYVVRDLQQLPDGLVPPPLLVFGDYVGPSTHVKGGIARLDVLLETTARVFGYVRDAGGLPIDTWVEFYSIDEDGRPSGAQRSVRSQKGYYESDLQAGLWRAELGGRGGSSGELEAPSEPKLLRLDPRSPTRADFALERGDGAIEGRIVDENGTPFPGLHCVGIRRFALPMPDTDRFLRVESQVFGMDASADGAFHAQRLAKGLYVLRVEPWTFNPFATPGDNRIGAVDPGTEVDLSSSSPARVQIGVRRSRPVRVSVEIEIASEWRKENAIPMLWPIARVVADDVLDNGLQVRRTVDSGQGRFQLHIEAALRNPRLELELGPAKAVYPITIPAGADVLPLVLRFPK